MNKVLRTAILITTAVFLAAPAAAQEAAAPRENYDARFVGSSYFGLSGLIWIPTSQKLAQGDARVNAFYYTTDNEEVEGAGSQYESTNSNPSIVYASSRHNEYSASHQTVEESYLENIAGLGWVPRDRSRNYSTFAFKHVYVSHLPTPLTFALRRSSVSVSDGRDGSELEGSLTASFPMEWGFAHLMYGFGQSSIGVGGVDFDDDWETFGLGAEYGAGENLTVHAEMLERHGGKKQLSDARAFGARYRLDNGLTLQAGQLNDGSGDDTLYLGGSWLLQNKRNKPVPPAPEAAAETEKTE